VQKDIQTMSRIGNPASRPFLPYVFLLALFALFPAAARADLGIEITPFAGFRFGGNFTDNTTGLDLDVDEVVSFGLILGIPATHETDYELFYSFQKTKLQGKGLFAGEPLFDPRAGLESVLLPLPGGWGEDPDLEKGGSAHRGERVPDDPPGDHGHLLRLVRRGGLRRAGEGGRIRPDRAPGGDIVRALNAVPGVFR
jgi:hypothetical protein